MSLSLSLNSALSGLSVNQAQLKLVSSNVANVNTEGYTRKTAQQSALVIGGVGNGVDLEAVRRNVDSHLQIELRDSLAQAGSLQAKDILLERTQDLFGAPGDDAALSNRMSNLALAVTAMSATPESSTLRIAVVDAASEVARQLNELSSDIQSLRAEADLQIADSVRIVNEQLQNITKLNPEIAQNLAQGQPAGELEDQRDIALDTISEHLEIRHFTRKNGEIVVFTPDGKTLSDQQAKTLVHAAAAAIGPTVSHAGGGIQPIDLHGIDITNLVSGGRIAGLVEMRDQILPNLQTELDRLTEVLRDQVNAVHNQGSARPPLQSLTGSRTFVDPATDSLTTTSAVRIAVVDATGRFVDYHDLPAGTYTVNDVRDAINTNIGAVATATTAAGGPLTISADTAGEGIVIVDLGSQTLTSGPGTYDGFSQFFGLNDFFVTPGNVQGDAITGISASLAVRSDLMSDPRKISAGRANDVTGAGAPVPGDVALSAGDNSIALTLSAKFDETLVFAAAGSLGPTSTSLAGYGAEIVANNAVEASAIKGRLDFQARLRDELTYRHQSMSGVNLDEELSNLILFQNAYSASARVVSTVQEMFDVLDTMMR